MPLEEYEGIKSPILPVCVAIRSQAEQCLATKWGDKREMKKEDGTVQVKTEEEEEIVEMEEGFLRMEVTERDDGGEVKMDIET